MREYGPWSIKADKFPKDGSLREQITFLIGYSILAPSTHNTQPWRFHITQNGCEIHFDPSIKLPYADPVGRDLLISIGYAVEFFILAAKRYRMFQGVTYRIDENNTCAAEVRCQISDGEDPAYQTLVEAIARRRNARGFFEKRSVPEIVLHELLSLVQKEYAECGVRVDFVVNPEHIERIARLTAEAVVKARKNSGFRREFGEWFHHNFSKNKDGIPGYAVRMPGIVSVVMAPLMRRFTLGAILGKVNYKSVASAPLIVVVSSPSDRRAWLNVGRASGRLMLELMAKDVQTSVYVASVEIGDSYKEVRQITGSVDRPQFLFIAGYLRAETRHTPRRPVEDVLLS